MDGGFLFLNANKFECDTLKEVLDSYEQAYGQMINSNNSEECFGKDVESSRIREIVDLLGVKQVWSALTVI